MTKVTSVSICALFLHSYTSMCMGDDRSTGHDTVGHTPVLLSAALELLAPQPGETVVDLTLGFAGHAKAFLDSTEPNGHLIGIDADPEHLAIARENLSSYGDRVEFHHCNFSELSSLHLEPVNIIFADLGLCSAHIDRTERGFSFKADAPLDLRFNTDDGPTGAELIEQLSEEELADILKQYGEIRQSRKLAHLLKTSGIRTTGDVRFCAEQVFAWKAPSVLPQIFQALRIVVNHELDALHTLLEVGPQLLVPGGRLGIMSYHSLEDRPVKHAFRLLSTPTKDPITGGIAVPAAYELVTKKPICPSANEVSFNPRSRSAKLRILRRLPF